jgi:hypothetical protein
MLLFMSQVCLALKLLYAFWENIYLLFFCDTLFTTPSIYNLRNSFEQEEQCENQDFIRNFGSRRQGQEELRYSSKRDGWYPLKLILLVESIVLKFVESILFHSFPCYKDIILLVFIAYMCWCHYFWNLFWIVKLVYRIAILVKNDTWATVVCLHPIVRGV